jgi:REP element-mobilizing transposase RayT
MGRPLRRQVPGQHYLFTTRCHQARFFLRPDPAVNRAVLHWLARAQRQFPRVRIYAVCIMSNHLHLVLCDEEAELAAWASYFLGNLARAVNRLRDRTGNFFERRYSAEPILDEESLRDRVLYVVANPVKAGLCSRARDWPGINLFAAGSRHKRVPVRSITPFKAQSVVDSAISAKAHQATAVLVIDPVPTSGRATGAFQRSVAARERELMRSAKNRRRSLTPAAVLAQSWSSAPRHPARSPRPVCHAADPALRAKFKSGFTAFVDAFREASTRAFLGRRGPTFPDWSFPPGRPLVRPA